jgi:hypothetical protein
MDAYPIQTTFAAGEISPLIYGRTDLAKYQSGAKRIRNFLVKPQGPAVRRSGTRYVNEVKNSSKKTLLKRFEFSATLSYILEFGEGYIRFYQDGGLVLSGSTIIEVATTYAESELFELDFAQSADVLYIAHKNHPPRKLQRYSATNWILTDIAFKDGPFMSYDDRGATMIVSGVTDFCTLKSTNAAEWVVGDVSKYIEVTYNGKIILALITAFVNGSEVQATLQENTIDPATIDGTTVVSYEATTASFPYDHLLSNTQVWGTDSENCFIKVDGTWYKTKRHESTRKTAGGTTYEVMEIYSPFPTIKVAVGTVTYSNRLVSGSVDCSHNVFDASQVGRKIRLNLSETQVWGTITAVVSSTKATVSFGRMVPFEPRHPDRYVGNGRTTLWRLGSWYPGNYPSSVTFHEERLCYASTPTQPQTIWFSCAGDYENFAPTDIDSKVLDDNAVTLTIASNSLNSILWLRSGPVLIAGTTGGEWVIRPNNLNEAITPTNFNVSSQTEYGSEPYLRGVRVGTGILFIQRNGRKLREMVYDFNNDAYVAKDISIVSEHLLRESGKAVSAAYQQEPTSILWIATESGALISVTYEREQEVVSWARQDIAGKYSNGNALVESVATLKTVNGDLLYMVVKRTINGVTKRYVEYLEKEFFPSDRLTKTDMFFVDCGLSYSGAPVSSVSGLGHLEGETVTIIGDEAFRGTAVVTGGSVAVPKGAASRIQVGLGYRSLIELLPLEGGSMNGTAQGKNKRLHKVVLRLMTSIGFKCGQSEDKLDEVSLRETDAAMDASPPLYSGDKEMAVDASYSLQAPLVIVQDNPYPLVVCAVMPKFTTYP